MDNAGNVGTPVSYAWTILTATSTSVAVNQVGPYIPTESLTFTATITGSPSVGTVTFYAGPGQTNPIGAPVNVVSGSATSTPGTTFVLGSNTVTAVYSGGTGFNGSQGTAPLHGGQSNHALGRRRAGRQPGDAPITFLSRSRAT